MSKSIFNFWKNRESLLDFETNAPSCRYFVDETPMWEENTDLVKNDLKYKPDESLAQYTGGIVKVCITPEERVFLRS